MQDKKFMTTQKMLSLMRKGIEKYKLIKNGDKIAVGISGGKDSLTLLKLLAEFRRFSPQKFELVAITVDLSFTGQKQDFTAIREFCNELNVEYYVEETEIGKIVFDVRKETNPCALCSKMRKGALNAKAKSLGCNKVALGHHSNDLVETMLLSFFYEGRLSTFAPKSYLDRQDLTVIRPLIFVTEQDVKSYSKTLPVAKSKCPADTATKRAEIKNIISSIAEKIPSVREMMFTSLIHPERYNLFDKFEKDSELLD